MTTSEPDPRTDLAGWLGLTETQANICRRDAIMERVQGTRTDA